MQRRFSHIKWIIILIVMVNLGNSLASQPVSAKKVRDYYINVGNEMFKVESFYSSSVTFKKRNVIVKGNLPLMNDRDEIIITKKRCKIKIDANCEFWCDEQKDLSFKKMRQYIKEAGNNSYVSITIIVKIVKWYQWGYILKIQIN